MHAHVLVPVKHLGAAKTRLAAVLSADERARLMREMLERVLAAVDEAGVGPVTVVSSEALSLNGVPRFDDRGLPWNEALAAAMREVVEAPVAAVVSADLPLLSPAEVRKLVAAAPTRGIAVGRSQDGGTNAVAMRPPAVVSTHFGEPSSSRRHVEAARALRLDHVVLDLPGIAFDVDTPDDLARYRGADAA